MSKERKPQETTPEPEKKLTYEQVIINAGYTPNIQLKEVSIKEAWESHEATFNNGRRIPNKPKDLPHPH